MFEKIEEISVKSVAIVVLAALGVFGQSRTGTVQGTVVDSKTQRPIPVAFVIAVREGLPSFAKNTKTGGYGEFQLQDLTPGVYSLCVQVLDDQHLNPCQWDAKPTTLSVSSGQNIVGVRVPVAAASVVVVQVQDSQQALSQLTKDGRRPDLAVGVIGPKGFYFPAHQVGISMSTPNTPGTSLTYRYQLAVPRDTALNLYIASHDLRLGDSAGLPLAASGNQYAFQHATGDPVPKSFAFSVLGRLP